MSQSSPDFNHCETARCNSCAIHSICVTHDTNTSANANKPIQRLYVPQTKSGAHVVWAGDEFKHLYAVKGGCIKTYTVDADGNERVRGFHLPGDLLGLDAIYTGIHPANASAVVPSNVCALPYTQIAEAVSDVPAMQGKLMRLMSKDLFTALSLAGDFSSDQRLAAFLLHLQERELERRMTSSNRIDLPMSRRDIASYLRLAPETVSRVLARFQKSGWIVSKPRSLLIQQPYALQELAAPVGILTLNSSLAKAA